RHRYAAAEPSYTRNAHSRRSERAGGAGSTSDNSGTDRRVSVSYGSFLFQSNQTGHRKEGAANREVPNPVNGMSVRRAKKYERLHHRRRQPPRQRRPAAGYCADLSRRPPAPERAGARAPYP